MEENKHFTIDWTNCRLCPRECGADRTRGFGKSFKAEGVKDQELYFFRAVI